MCLNFWRIELGVDDEEARDVYIRAQKLVDIFSKHEEKQKYIFCMQTFLCISCFWFLPCSQQLFLVLNKNRQNNKDAKALWGVLKKVVTEKEVEIEDPTTFQKSKMYIYKTFS